MNQSVANILKGYIECLDFVDKIAGLVRTVNMNIIGEGGVKVLKSFPVSCDVTSEDCETGMYRDLCPDSSFKSIVYFEDGGCTFNKRDSRFVCWTSNLKLVCWLNIPLLEADLCQQGVPCTLAAATIKKILCQFPSHPVTISPFVKFLPTIVSEDIKSSSIFSKYTYAETQSQYLLYPFDYFALNITTDFCICVEDCEICT